MEAKDTAVCPLVLTLVLSQSSLMFLWQNFLTLVSAVSEACRVDELQQQAGLYVCLPFPSSKMQVALAPHLQSVQDSCCPNWEDHGQLSGNLHLSEYLRKQLYQFALTKPVIPDFRIGER